MNFKDLKKHSKLGTLTEKLVKDAESKVSYEDERFWKLNVDKAGNGYAVIRFLPPVGDEEKNMVELHSHNFKGPNGWFIKNCPTTKNIGKPCPVCEANKELWASNDEKLKKIASSRKRKLSYISNILIIKDPSNPENEGTVRLFKYGKKIYDKIIAAAKPVFEDDPTINAFDMWLGADFRLKAQTDGSYRSYDSSEFSSPNPISEDDSEIEKIWNQVYPLLPLVAEDQFESYSDLKKRFDQVTGTKSTSSFNMDEEDDQRSASSSSVVESDDDEEDDDETLSFFKQLSEA